MELDVTMPEWALDILGKEAEIVELSVNDLALLFIAEKVVHTQTGTDDSTNPDHERAEAGE